MAVVIDLSGKRSWAKKRREACGCQCCEIYELDQYERKMMCSASMMLLSMFFAVVVIILSQIVRIL